MIIGFIIVTLLLSSFFSGSEIAFVAANRLRVEVHARRGGFVGRTVKRFIDHPTTLLTTTLVGNNVALVVYATLFAIFLVPPLEAFFAASFGLQASSLEITVLVTQTIAASTIVLFLGEIIPKSILREVANSAVFALAVPLRITYFLLLPLIKISQWSALLLMKVFRANEESYGEFMRRDFEIMIEEGKLSGDLDLDKEEATLLSNVFAMASIKVKESMVPRTDIVAVEVGTSTKDLLDTFVASGHSKLPVYEENIDNIVGVAFAYDLFDEPASLQDMMRPATFIPESKLSKHLLQEFLQSKTSIAIVIDEYGGTAGLATTEDLLEELFGDIQDEFDDEDLMLQTLDEDTVLASGRIEVDELAEETGFLLPEGDYETVAGYLLDRLGTIPKTRDEFELDGFRIVVLQASANRVDLVRLHRLAEQDSVRSPKT
ncbi:MAG: hemolysin family protein [Rhodothermia bacterium]|nr:MAG: hemolysin family protein [Rhodothermia bacterium]